MENDFIMAHWDVIPSREIAQQLTLLTGNTHSRQSVEKRAAKLGLTKTVNFRRKLSDAEREEVRQKRAAGLTCKELAEAYGVSETTIFLVCK